MSPSTPFQNQDWATGERANGGGAKALKPATLSSDEWVKSHPGAAGDRRTRDHCRAAEARRKGAGPQGKTGAAGTRLRKQTGSLYSLRQ